MRTLEARGRALLDRPLDLDRDPPLHRQREAVVIVVDESDRQGGTADVSMGAQSSMGLRQKLAQRVGRIDRLLLSFGTVAACSSTTNGLRRSSGSCFRSRTSWRSSCCMPGSTKGPPPSALLEKKEWALDLHPLVFLLDRNATPTSIMDFETS